MKSSRRTMLKWALGAGQLALLEVTVKLAVWFRHLARKRNKIAEIKVPAWPIPTQKTKLVMSTAQYTGGRKFQRPRP